MLTQAQALREQARSVIICGSEGYAVATTDGGELWTTRTETENDVWSSFIGTLNSTFYAIQISKDNPDFPHKKLGQNGTRIDLTNIYLILDIGAGADGVLRMGIIRRIDGTDADIEYFMYLPFLGGVAKELIIQEFKGNPSQLKASIDNGSLLHGITNNRETNVAAVNTGITLTSPAGNITPGEGDIILKYEHTGGSTNVNLFTFYHNSD